MKIQVYPGGVLVSPILLRSAVILTRDITEIRIKKELTGGRFIELRYSSAGLRSPLMIAESPESNMGRAIEQITGMKLTVK